MKHLYASLFAACMVAPAAFGAVTCDDIQKANIFHAFNWKFTDIQSELDRIAAAGYGAVQVSPVQGNCKENAEWYYAYMPYDFAMGTSFSKRNGNGTRDELKALCEAANAKGVQIIVDVVANHVNSKDNNRDKFWRNDAHQRDTTLHSMLAAMKYPDYPVALGVIRAVEDATVYDREVARQVEEVKAQSKIHSVDELLHSGATWEIE